MFTVVAPDPLPIFIILVPEEEPRVIVPVCAVPPIVIVPVVVLGPMLYVEAPTPSRTKFPVPTDSVKDVAPVVLPNVFMLAPVVARVVAPTDVKVEPADKEVVVVKLPGVVIADGKLNVRTPTPPVEVI